MPESPQHKRRDSSLHALETPRKGKLVEATQETANIQAEELIHVQ